MKILMISPHFELPEDPIPVGGVQRHVAGVSRELRARGHTVTWIYPNDVVTRTGQVVQTEVGLDWADAVVMHDFCSWQETVKPNIQIFHGWEGQFPPSQAVVDLRRGIAKMAGATIAVGSFIPKWYGHTVDEVVWGATDLPTSDEPRIEFPGRAMWVGRLEPDTGFAEAVQSAVRIGLEVHVYGDGSLRVPIERWRDNTPGARVVLYGFVPGACTQFRTAGLALPSGYLTYLEALVRRRPCAVVATNPLKQDYWMGHPFPPDPHRDWSAAWDWARKQTWAKLADTYERLLGKQ